MKNFFIVSFLGLMVFVSGLTVVSAQTVDSSDTAGLRAATEEELEIMNSKPEVYVTDLAFEDKTYLPGEIVRGSFTLINTKETRTPNIFYSISLTTSDTQGEYNIQKSTSLVLLPNEEKEVNFVYTLPVSIGGADMLETFELSIMTYTENDWPLGWERMPIKVEVANFSQGVEITEAFLSLNEENYSLQAGPTVLENEVLELAVSLSNSGSENITIAPRITLFGKDVNGEILRSYDEKALTLEAKGKVNVKYILPIADLQPLVYTGEFSFVSKDDEVLSNIVKFRYIVGGNIATIRGVTVDQDKSIKGEILNVKILSTGTPLDISHLNATGTTPVLGMLDLKIYNENDSLVASYSGEVDINNLPSSLDLEAGRSAEAFRVVVTVTDKDGIILDEYSANLSNYEEYENEESTLISKTLLAGIIILILILLAIFMMYKKSKKAVILGLFVLFALASSAVRVDAWTVDSYSDNGWDWVINGTSVTVSSPQPQSVRTYYPGEAIKLDTTVYANACSNGANKIQVFAGYDSTYTSLPLAYDSGEMALCGTPYGQQNKRFETYSVTAPSTPGLYKLYIVARVTYTPENLVESQINGWQQFLVVQPPTNLTSSCTTAANGVSTANVSWTAVANSSTYPLRIDQRSTATDYATWSNDCANPNTGDICRDNTTTSYSFTTTPGKTFGWWVYSLVNGVLSPTALGTPFTCPAVDTPPSPVTLLGPTCSDGIQNQSETDIDCGGPYCEACTGDDGNGDVSTFDSNLDCTISSNAIGETVNVNTNTTWTLGFASTTSTLNVDNYTKTWESSNNGADYVSAGGNVNPLNKILTTIGVKTIKGQISTTTGIGNECFATTTVVQSGGTIGEI